MLTPFSISLKFKAGDIVLNVEPGRLSVSGSFASDFIDMTPPMYLELQEVKELYAVLALVIDRGGEILQLPKDES